MHQDTVTAFAKNLEKLVREKDFSTDYASFSLPFTQEFTEASRKVLEEFRAFQNIAIVGIGGSNLGTMAIHHALGAVTPMRKKVFFFDTTDPFDSTNNLFQIRKRLDAGEKILVTVISKSGGTTETLAFSAWITHILEKEYPEQVRILTISNPDSALDCLSREQNWARLSIPEKVGGRFSVFSSVGLFPLAFIGIDIEKLLFGARKALEDFFGDPQGHMATTVAVDLHANFPRRNIFEHWFFAKKLENLGKWYRQLLAESIGKVRADDSVGITPVCAIGTIDLHSVAQLSIAHPNDRSVAIVSERYQDEVIVADSPFLSILPHLRGKTFGQIMSAARNGFVEALQHQQVPVYEYTINTDDEYDIGYWIQTKMLEVAILAELFGINGFDQPNVEDYKKGMEKELRG